MHRNNTLTVMVPLIGLTLVFATFAKQAIGQIPGFRPPAVPLVTSDPYLSIWSEADRLTDDATRHWTGREHSLVSIIRIDGQNYRLMGIDPPDVPAMPQTGLLVFPTRSVYDFQNDQVHVTMTFMTPALPTDLDAMALPLSYITWEVHSIDGKEHRISIYDSVSSELAVNEPTEQVVWSHVPAGSMAAMKIGTESQPILGSCGDDHRIDWGYAYLAAPVNEVKTAIGADKTLVSSFVNDGQLPTEADTRMPRAVNDDQPVMAVVFPLGEVGAKPVKRDAIVAYDEIYSIKYFGQNLRPYWRRNGETPVEMLQKAQREYPELTLKCERFDHELMADLAKVGGEKYAQMCALAYRQALAACGFAADPHKQPLFFTKENTSNGDIATVDVIFPMDPMLILLSPTLAKATVVPDLAYADSWHWKFPNAPHDLGTYPLVFGRDDGGEGMPVEESGNMLILCDAICQDDGNANFVKPWWNKLTQWAEYLQKYGLDPENQLCTDDFMGHLAHNANLSIKAILGLAAYGDMCRMRGETAKAEKYTKMARVDAKHWVKVADAGGHSLLAFDKPGTWSQKYNLAWDHILGLNIFPPSVAAKEVAFYKTKLEPYGLPLDSRTLLTKTDWTNWSASLATKQSDFEELIAPIYRYLNETTTRVPFVDSYITNDIHSNGMHARPVIGGVFIRMLDNKAMWHKWSSMDKNKVGGWAPLPPKPIVKMVVPTSQKKGLEWRYTTEKPASNWMEPDFDDSNWSQGLAGFGTPDPNVTPNTSWTTDDIWIRREFTMPKGDYKNLQFFVYHDEDVQIYVNGVFAASEGGYNTEYTPLNIFPAALKILKPGAKIVIAAHCHQTVGGQFIDIGLVNVTTK